MNQEETQRILKIINETRAWFNYFGAHSPISFGGENHIDEKLRQAQILLEQQVGNSPKATEYQEDCQCVDCRYHRLREKEGKEQQ